MWLCKVIFCQQTEQREIAQHTALNVGTDKISTADNKSHYFYTTYIFPAVLFSTAASSTHIQILVGRQKHLVSL